jgi:hypothetical protein
MCWHWVYGKMYVTNEWGHLFTETLAMVNPWRKYNFCLK